MPEMSFLHTSFVLSHLLLNNNNKQALTACPKSAELIVIARHFQRLNPQVK